MGGCEVVYIVLEGERGLEREPREVVSCRRAVNAKRNDIKFMVFGGRRI